MRYLVKLIPLGLYLFANHSLAHGFDERYDLPIPIEYFLLASALVLLVSFLLMMFSLGYWKNLSQLNFSKTIKLVKHPLLCGVLALLRFFSVAMLLLVILAGYAGPQNPLMNLAPTFIWINWWIGTSLACAFLGNLWPAINPWSNLFNYIEYIAQAAGLKHLPRLSAPNGLGLYPATMLLLLWSWLEVVYPIAFVPQSVASLVLFWTVISLLGMIIFGKAAWQQHFDFFSIYFAFMGEFGILKSKESSLLVIRPFGYGILASENTLDSARGLVPFIVAMLSIVLFDGLHGSGAWPYFQDGLQRLGIDRFSGNGYLEGTLGLLLLWLLFLGSYYCLCYFSHCITPTASTEKIAHQFSRPLIPIAIAYLIAHNFSSLVIQGQSFIFLISDPLGLGWDLFGSVQYRPQIDLIEVGQIWYLAVFAIVIGHVIALLLTHIKAFQMSPNSKDVNLLCLPQTIFMILLTMVSLMILAEPLTSSEFSILRIWFGMTP